jgi:spore coat protein U-like protein
MKPRIPIGLAVAAIALAPLAHAADVQVEVTATVLAECSFTTTGPTMSFGNLLNNSAVDATGLTSLSFKCSKGAPYRLQVAGLDVTTATTAPRTLTSLSGGSAEPGIPYTLQWETPASAIGKGFGLSDSTDQFDLRATIASADLKTARPGTYSDQVQVTLNPSAASVASVGELSPVPPGSN